MRHNAECPSIDMSFLKYNFFIKSSSLSTFFILYQRLVFSATSALQLFLSEIIFLSDMTSKATILSKKVIHRATECFGKNGEKGNVGITFLSFPF